MGNKLKATPANITNFSKRDVCRQITIQGCVNFSVI